MLLLCKGTICGDCHGIRSLLSEPPNAENAPWYMSDVHDLLVQGAVKMHCPIAVSIMVRNYDATKELLLHTDLDMKRKTVDWSGLKFTILHESWIYSIAPWVVNLKLGNNGLRNIPSHFLDARQLRRLDLSRNFLENLSVDLFSLQNIESLNLSHNKLKELSDSTVWSSSLINLDLSHNCLTTLPSGIQNSMLEVLQLSHNKFTNVPKCVCRIHTLTTLDLSYMPITSLPGEMEYLDKLANLNVANCNISDIHGNNPQFGVRAIRALIKSRSRSSRPCNHIKMVILCNSSIGMTVMYSRLRQTLSPPSLHLHDMEMFQWSYRPIKFFSQKLIFNTWMMGVQKEYKSLYQCFYTASALYTLVWDMTRTGDMTEQLKPYIDGIYFKYPSANIMIVVILPEPVDQWAETNTTVLVKRVTAMLSQPNYKTLQFHGIQFLSNGSNTRDTQPDIRIKIYEMTTLMTVNSNNVISRQFPENYFNLIPVIEKEHTSLKAENRPGIAEEGNFWHMFDSNLATDMPDSMELPVVSSFLQETGYLLHFEDPNDRLDQHYFLHPEWLISTFHSILLKLHGSNPSRPVVSYAMICKYLKLGESNQLNPVLIRLLVRYTILLPISKDEYLVPSLLPSNSPPLAMLQIGCHRRQFIPKGKALPEYFWYYLITNILFHLPHLLDFTKLSTNRHKGDDKEGIERQVPGQLRFISNDEESTLSSPIEQTKPPLSPPEVDAAPSSKKIGGEQHTMEMKNKMLFFNEEEGLTRPRSKASVYNLKKFRANADPIELLPGIIVWRTGIQISTPFVKISVYPQKSDLGLEESGIEVCASDGKNGQWVMGRMCWLIQRLLHQRYPEFSPDLQLSSNNGLTQLIICPSCMNAEVFNTKGGGATNFIIETCFVALKELEMYSHTCHHHSKPIAMEELIPEYVMADIPSAYNLKPDQFTYQDTKPIYRESGVVLCDGMFDKEMVTVKMHIINETKSYSVPLSAIRQEIDMLTHLDHPNIIEALGFCLSPPVVILEKSPHGTLLQKLNDNEQQISRLTRFHIARQTVSALAYLHEKGIIYRSLKSDSILTWSLDFEDEVSIKLIHFDRAAYSTPSGLLGHLDCTAYPAPEMIRYDFTEEYSEKVDIYSFGMLLYELIARWQPFSSDKVTIVPKPKLTGLQTYGFQTLIKLMEHCTEEEACNRPSASNLVKIIADPKFQSHLSTQMLRDCLSVRGCCFIPSLWQLWAYGEYNMAHSLGGQEPDVEGTQVFILNAQNLTVQGSLELRERANAICAVDCRVWIGMLEACIHVYDSNTFQFTDRLHVKDSVTSITTNDTFAFVGLANGMLTYYDKLSFPRQSNTIKIGNKAIIAMVSIGDCLWVTCGHEIIILNAYDEITVVKRWVVCDSNDQVYALAPSKESTCIWSIIRGSLVVTSWDVNSASECGSIDLATQLKDIYGEKSRELLNIRLLSMECSQNVLWVGLSSGIIILLTATRSPMMISWFKAHCSGVRCLIEIPGVNPELHIEEVPIVISGGYGQVSFINPETTVKGGVVMSWQSLLSRDLQTIVNRAVI